LVSNEVEARRFARGVAVATVTVELALIAILLSGKGNRLVGATSRRADQS
jgi:hypothetical protein